MLSPRVAVITVVLPEEGEHIGVIGDSINSLTAHAPSYEQIAAALSWLAGHFDHKGHLNDLRAEQNNVTLRYHDVTTGNIEAMGVQLSWQIV